jgi:hypothetical protein
MATVRISGNWRNRGKMEWAGAPALDSRGGARPMKPPAHYSSATVPSPRILGPAALSQIRSPMRTGIQAERVITP